MAKITQIRVSTKEDSTLVSLAVEGIENRVYLTPKQIKANTGLGTAFHVLKGSDIEVTFYDKGEKLYDGKEVTEDGKIVKEFVIEPSQMLSQMQMMGAFNVAMKF